MKKTETYLTPKTKVVELESMALLCASDFKSSGTEGFIEGDEYEEIL